MKNIRTPTGPPQPQGPGEDPLTHYTRIFAKFFQSVFGSFERGNYRWESDQNLTEITITDQATTDADAVERRPAIIIARGPVASGNLAMDQFAGPHFKNGQLVPNQDAATGTKRYTDLLAASVSVNCLSSVGLEAQRLAWICFMSVRRLKRTLMMAGMHRVGEDLSVGAESAPGALVTPDENEIVMVSVNVPFYFQDFWSVEPVDKTLLKNVGVAVRSELNHPAPGATVIREPGLNGKTLTYSKKISLDQRVQVKPSTPKPRR